MSTQHSSFSTSPWIFSLTFTLSMTSSTTSNPSSSSLSVRSASPSTTQSASPTTSFPEEIQSTAAENTQTPSTEDSMQGPQRNLEQNGQVTQGSENGHTIAPDDKNGNDKPVSHLDNGTATLHIGLSFTILITLALVIIIAVASFAIVYVLRKKHRLQQQRAQQSNFSGIGDMSTTNPAASASGMQHPMDNQMTQPGPDPPPYDGNRAPIMFHAGQWQTPVLTSHWQGAGANNASSASEKPPLEEGSLTTGKCYEEMSQATALCSEEEAQATGLGSEEEAQATGDRKCNVDEEPDYLVVVGNDQVVELDETQIRL